MEKKSIHDYSYMLIFVACVGLATSFGFIKEMDPQNQILVSELIEDINNTP